MTALQPERRDRLIAAIGAAGVQALLVYTLVVGLGVTMPVAVRESLETFAILPEPPPPPVKIVPPKKPSYRPEGAASPPNLRSKATEIVVPPPVVRVVVPSPVVTAPVAGIGNDPSAGASDRVGPGTGSGGEGNGTGSGGRGNGDGAGDVPPRQIKGRIKDSDYPREAAEAGIRGGVDVRYRVDLDGRARDCVVVKSSGSGILDETTCRLIEERFRFKPAHDARGHPFVSWIVHGNDWILERDPEPPANP